MKPKIFNYDGGTISVKWNKDAAAEPVEIMVYDTIGKDPWDGTGITSATFQKALNEAPKDRELHCRVNSKGGDVHEGLAIRNLLSEWPKKVTTTIDGVAASTSSWAFSPGRNGDEVRAPRASQMFIHDAMSFGMGNAEDFRKAADDLDKTSDQIAQMYADKTGKRQTTMRQLMKDETLMTGEEAEEMGLVDTLTDGKSVRNFTTQEITQIHNQLSAFRNSLAVGDKTQNQNKDPMKKRMIALLNKHGITEVGGVKITSEMTDEQLTKVNDEQLEAAFNTLLEKKNKELDVAPRNQDIINLQAEMGKLNAANAQLTEANNAAKKLRITNEVEKVIADDKLPANQKDYHIKLAMGMTDTDCATHLANLSAVPARPPGGEPLNADVECVSESIKDIQNHILNNGCRMIRNFIGPAGAAKEVDLHVVRDIANRGKIAAVAMRKHLNKFIEMFNTNTLDSELQRTVILTVLLRAFAVRLLPLRAFCTTFSNVPLEGTDKVAVPYFALQTVASTAWNATNGYVTQDTAQSMREVTVNKRQYQAMAFTSQELRRQPYQNWEQLALMNAEKLGVDVNADVLSLVTAANYGASVKAVAAAAFSGDDVADLYVTATDLNWPDTGRSLVLGSAYKGALLKDPGFKYSLNYGDNDPVRKAAIKSAYGFEDIYTVPTANLPANGENLKGFISHLSAALVATAPIMPTPEVRALMTQYDMVVDPVNSIALEYRRMGDAPKDKTIEVVECNYGYAKGRGEALGRITSQ